MTGDHESGIELVLTHGVTKRMDIGILIPYAIGPQSGHQPAEIGIKYALIQNDQGYPVFAITFGAELGENEYSVNTIFSHEFNVMSLHLNLGFSTPGLLDEPALINYSVFADFPLGERLFAGAEILGEYIAAPGNSYLLGVGLGGGVHITDSITWSLGSHLGIVNSSDFSLSTGFTLGF